MTERSLMQAPNLLFIVECRHRRRTMLLCLGILTFLTTGCGPSKQDLLMRAASRGRAPTEDDDDGAKKPLPDDVRLADQVQTEGNRANQSEPEASLAENGSESEAGLNAELANDLGEETLVKSVPKVDLAIKPIGDRQPELPLADDQRRQMALDHMKAIHAAMMKYVEKRGAFPRSEMKSPGGIATLSWRVELLPFLGYEDLYEQFDASRPWDKEPNKGLLKFIPDEYVSAERFDEKTNFLVPLGSSFVFNRKRNVALRDVEDGLENTIILLEVNDDYAVPWTQPVDYEPKIVRGNYGPIKDGLGGLRGDGTFAIWGNGWPVLLANGLRPDQFHKAFTMDSFDQQVAGHIHREVTIEKVSDASVAVSTPELTAENPRPMHLSQVEPIVQRQPVPNASSLAAAKKRLESVYAARIRNVNKNDEKAELAAEFLAASVGMESDPAGAYVLQSAAMRFGSETATIGTVLAAVDYRIGRFEVDAYEENANALIEFGQANTQTDPANVAGDEYLRRSVRTVFAAVHNDDYGRASVIVRYANRFLDQPRDEPLPILLNRLRALLGSAQRQYGQAKDKLALYRDDPDDGEAAATFGRYLCFIKGDWRRGLPLLAKGGPESLQEIASMDLNVGDSLADHVSIGDAWWRLGQQTRVGLYRQGAMDRATYWYEGVITKMADSLDKMHVKARLDEHEESDPASPMALMNELATESGVDLGVSLASVADVGQQPGRRRTQDDDEDD